MQKKRRWKTQQPQMIRSGSSSVLMDSRLEVIQDALLDEQEVQEYIDELEPLKRELKCANERKDEYLSIAAHELRTPITVIMAHAQMIKRNIEKRSDVSPDLETLLASVKIIDEQTHRLRELVDDLLDPVNMRHGKMRLQREWVDLAQVCSEVVEDQRLLSGRIIELELPSAPVLMPLDRNRISQVITNLVSNALKYSPTDLPVRVQVDQRDDLVILLVSDAGSGIAADQQTHIFEPFYRTPEAWASSKYGLGLGLAICKDIVEQHNGRIWCDSSVGNGSTFGVELPSSQLPHSLNSCP
jgi:signal transduction histidine kinase